MPDASPRSAGWFAAITLASVVPTLLTLWFGPQSGLETLVILVPWLGMLAAHAVFGLLTLIAARAEGRRVLFSFMALYLTGFTGLHLVGWAITSEVPERLEIRYLEYAQPADYALYELAGQPSGDPGGLDERVRTLAAEGADLDRMDPWGMTALYRAAAQRLPLTRALLQAGADPNRLTEEHGAPIHIAIRQGEVEIVLALLASGADPDLAEPGGARPICRVIASRGAAGELSDDGLRMLDGLLAAGADPGTCAAFSMAVGLQQTNGLRALLAAGYVASQAEAGPLADAVLQAVRSGDVPWMELLLEAGADGTRALPYAIERRQAEIVRILLEAGADARAEPFLVATAGRRDADAITDLLLAHGADPHAQDSKGRTPLVQAARAAHDDNVRRLVELGADPDWIYEDEPLVLSMQTMIPKQKHVTALLVELGADPNTHGSEGHTPLMRATRNSHHELMQALIDAGAELDAVDDARWTALHHAAVTRFEGLIGLSLLLDAGARVEAYDSESRTPLCVAQAEGNVPAAEYLQSKGAHPQDCWKKRPPVELRWRGRRAQAVAPF